MSLMLSVKSFFTKFWNNFIDKISTAPVIVALCFLVVGLSFSILAGRFERKSDVDENGEPVINKTVVAFKVIAIFFVFGAFLLFLFTSI